MTITVELPLEIEAQFVAQARDSGLSLDDYAREVLARSARARFQGSVRSTAEMNRLLDEAADMVPAGTPSLPDEAMSRDSIYTREDEW